MYSKTASVGGHQAPRVPNEGPTKSSGQPTKSHPGPSALAAQQPDALRLTGAGGPLSYGPIIATESSQGKLTYGPGPKGGQPGLPSLAAVNGPPLGGGAKYGLGHSGGQAGRSSITGVNGRPAGRAARGPAQSVIAGQSSTAQSPTQNFGFFLVVNFQATCDVHFKPQPEPREIIEFTAAKVNSQTFSVDAVFHQYVSPKVNKKLTKFCVQLTGISQCMVDGQSGIEQCFKKLSVWLNEQGLLKPEVMFATVSRGDWCLQELLPKSLGASSSAIPEYFRKWIEISKIFQSRTGLDPTDNIDPLSGMLSVFDLQFEGPRHSGIYVCHNVTKLMKALATERQCVFNITSQSQS